MKMMTLRNVLILLSTYFIVTGCAQQEPLKESPDQPITTFLVVRHAEKMSEQGDPALTEAGQARAKALSEVLYLTQLDSIYSTNTLRTRSTAQPVAESKNMAIGLIEKDTTMLETLLPKHQGKTLLVVAHSNTVPGLVNHILGTQLPNIPDTVFDRIYMVSVKEKGKGKVDVIRYGE